MTWVLLNECFSVNWIARRSMTAFMGWLPHMGLQAYKGWFESLDLRYAVFRHSVTQSQAFEDWGKK